MDLALRIFAVDAVLALILLTIWLTGWATNDARYRKRPRQ